MNLEMVIPFICVVFCGDDMHVWVSVSVHCHPCQKNRSGGKTALPPRAPPGPLQRLRFFFTAAAPPAPSCGKASLTLRMRVFVEVFTKQHTSFLLYFLIPYKGGGWGLHVSLSIISKTKNSRTSKQLFFIEIASVTVSSGVFLNRSFVCISVC